jgi:putative adenylate-forming enzyme
MFDFETRFFPIFYLTTKYRFKYYSKNQIKKYQKRKAIKIAKYAAKNSNYYSNLFKNENLDDVWNLPTTNKAKMMADIGAFNTLNISTSDLTNFCLKVEKERDFTSRLNGINIAMSSGTSGNKGIIITTPHEENYLRAAFFSRFTFPNKEKLNLAFILRVSTPAFDVKLFGHKLAYISQLDSIENIVNKLNNINPNVISASPSMFQILAKEIANDNLKVKPQKIICYAEVLSPDIEDSLAKSFCCPVHQIYQCSEGSIAISCKLGGLHLNEDLIAVQLYKEDGTEARPSEPCQKMIITDLHKKSQPIIRYELNDLVTINPEKCDCGSNFRLIESIQGRRDDMLWARRLDNNDWQFILPDYIRRAIVASSDNVIDYQVIQYSPAEVEARIMIKNQDLQQSEGDIARQAIEGVFEKLNCPKPTVKVIFMSAEVNINSKKLVRVIRKFNVEDYKEKEE